MSTKTDIYDHIKIIFQDYLSAGGDVNAGGFFTRDPTQESRPSTLQRLATLPTITSFQTYDQLIEQLPLALTNLVVPNQSQTNSGNDMEQKVALIETIDALLDFGIFNQQFYVMSKPLLKEDNRVALARIFDDLFDMLSFLRGVRPNHWQAQGLESKYQELREKARPYLISEVNGLPQLTHNSRLVRDMLNAGKLNEEHTPGMPSLVHSYIPKFTGKGLDTFNLMNPFDKELAFATMGAFQAEMRTNTQFQFTSLSINQDALATSSRITQAQLERTKVEYIIPNTVLDRVNYFVNLANNVRDGKVKLTDGQRKELIGLGKMEMGLLHDTLNELNLYVHATDELFEEVQKYHPQFLKPDFERFDALALHDYLGLVDTSIVAVRRLTKESRVYKAFARIKNQIQIASAVADNAILIPLYSTNERIFQDGTDMTPSERKLRRMNHYQFACEALGGKKEELDIQGHKINDLLDAVQEGKRIIREAGQYERNIVDYNTITDRLRKFIDDPIDINDPGALVFLVEEQQNAERLQMIAEALGKYNPDDVPKLVEAATVSSGIQDIYNRYCHVQYERLIKIAEKNIGNPQGDLSALLKDAELLMKVAEIVKEADWNLIRPFYREVSSALEIQRLNMQGFRLYPAQGIMKGDPSSLAFGGPTRNYDAGGLGDLSKIKLPGYKQVSQIVNLDPTAGVIDEIKEGTAEMNWVGLAYSSLAIIAAISEVTGITFYIDPKTQDAATLKQKRMNGMVDLMGQFSMAHLSNTRGDPFASDQTYWGNGLRYDMGAQAQMTVTSLGLPGSGMNPINGIGTGTNSFTLAEQYALGFVE